MSPKKLIGVMEPDVSSRTEPFVMHIFRADFRVKGLEDLSSKECRSTNSNKASSYFHLKKKRKYFIPKMTYLAANCHPSPSAMPHVLCLSLLWILGCVSTAWAQPARFLHRQLMAPRAGMAVTPTQHLPAPEQAVLCQLPAQALPSPFHPQALSNLNVSGFVSFLKKKQTSKQTNKKTQTTITHRICLATQILSITYSCHSA